MSKGKKIAVSCTFLIWVAFMIVIFQQSDTPYKEQDMKPFLRQKIHLEASEFPALTFYYDNEKVTTQEPYAFIEFCIRKLGHITEYTILTFLTAMFLLMMRIKTWKAYMAGGLFSVSYAASDEWHQSFVPGRTGHVIDVVTFDLFGIFFGLLMTLILRIIFGAIRSRNDDGARP